MAEFDSVGDPRSEDIAAPGPIAVPPHLTTTFRALLVTSTVLYALAYWLPYFDGALYSADLTRLRAWDGFGARVHLTLLGQLTWYTADIVAPVLMFFYVSWARSAFLFLSLIGVLAQFGWGVRVTTPIEGFFFGVMAMADGAALAMAYFTPVRLCFATTESEPPRGADGEYSVGHTPPLPSPPRQTDIDAGAEHLRQVYVAPHPTDAHLVKGLLEARGIPAMVRGEALFGLRGGVPFAADTAPSVWILDAAALEAAQEIVDEYVRNRAAEARSSTPWDCPKCGEHLEGQFTDCWRCGTPRQG